MLELIPKPQFVFTCEEADNRMLEVFFKPKSVAVIGATRDVKGLGGSVLHNIVAGGYPGPIFPINPKAAEIQGLKAYPTVLDVSEDIDLAVITTPSRFVPQVVEECGKKGIKGAIVISAGFREVGSEGRKLEREVGDIAARYGVRVIGPNVLGVTDSFCPLNATFAALPPGKGSTAFMSQSGALMAAILDWSVGEGFGFSKMVSLGNKLDVDEIDLLEAWADDPETKVILGYLEGIADGPRFIEAAKKVTRKKPVVIIKSGTTAAGSRAISSHTGTLAGSDQAYRAGFKQAGVIRATSVQELFDYAFAFSNQPLPKGDGIAVVTNAGGPGILASDAAERLGMRIAHLTEETTAKLQEVLPPTASAHNPIDVIGDALADRYAAAAELALQDPHVNALVVLLTPQVMTQVTDTAKAIAGLSGKYGKPILTSFMGAAEVREGVEILSAAGIPNYEFPERVMESLSAMVRQQKWLETPEMSVSKFNANRLSVANLFNRYRKEGRLTLGETEARLVLTAYGIPVPASSLASTPADAARMASEIGFPVVMKIASPDILHKSDVGGVVVGLKDKPEVERAYLDMMSKVRPRMPQADIWGVNIAEMVPKGREVIIGMNRDPQFGPLLMFGLGGIYVEVLKDVSFRVAPIHERSARNMMAEIRSYQLLLGARGEPPADLQAATECLLRVSQLVTDFPEILELDINPLVLMPEGNGAVALDARMTLAPLPEK
ncbi:MAG TPA: acetate--CoA ligase family protein [Chloroflexota bacterium]